MPWSVERTDECPTSRPWGVVAEDTGTVAGCHETEDAARSQQAALEAEDVRGTTVERKALSAVEVKDESEGTVEAVFSTFDVIDDDNDVVRPGAFQDGAKVRISAYGHRSWHGELPVGRGTIRTTDSEAILDGKFFLDTTHGRDTFATVKQMGDLQEWSYSLDSVEESFGEYDGEDVRFLNRITVTEVSPVLRGASVNTRTLAAKATCPQCGTPLTEPADTSDSNPSDATRSQDPVGSNQIAEQYARYVMTTRS